MSTHPRRASAPVRWVPVDQLTSLARALLSEDLGGRDEIPEHVADRVTALAAQWAAHGFTQDTVRPWVDLPPASAAYLAGRDVDPSVLDQPINTSATATPLTLGRAIASGRLTVEQAYDLLVATGTHRPDVATPSSTTPSGTQPQPTPADPQPAEPSPAPPRPAPAVFSHPAADHIDRDHRRRTRPSQTPFRP